MNLNRKKFNFHKKGSCPIKFPSPIFSTWGRDGHESSKVSSICNTLKLGLCSQATFSLILWLMDFINRVEP